MSKKRLFAQSRHYYERAQHYFQLAESYAKKGNMFWARAVLIEAMELEAKGDRLHLRASHLHS